MRKLMLSLSAATMVATGFAVPADAHRHHNSRYERDYRGYDNRGYDNRGYDNRGYDYRRGDYRYDNGRNYSDDQLRAVAREGGCVGCMTSAAALADKDDRKNHSLERYIQHLEHMLEVLGEDHLVLGLHYTEYLYPGPDFLDTRGLEDASRTGNIIGALRRRGWPEETIGKVAWGNVFRLFRDTLA